MHIPSARLLAGGTFLKRESGENPDVLQPVFDFNFSLSDSLQVPPSPGTVLDLVSELEYAEEQPVPLRSGKQVSCAGWSAREGGTGGTMCLRTGVAARLLPNSLISLRFPSQCRTLVLNAHFPAKT